MLHIADTFHTEVSKEVPITSFNDRGDEEKNRLYEDDAYRLCTRAQVVIEKLAELAGVKCDSHVITRREGRLHVFSLILKGHDADIERLEDAFRFIKPGLF